MTHPDALRPAELPADFHSPGLSLRQVLAILRGHRRWILLVTLGTLLAGTVLSLVLPKTYEATATLLIDFEVNDPITGRDFPQMLAASYMTTQIGIINSPEVLLPVVDQLGLANDPALLKRYEGRETSAGALRDFVAVQFAKKLIVSNKGDSRLIYITYQADSPKGAAEAANAVARVYLEQTLDRATRPARQRAGEYAGQLDGLRNQVNEAQSALAKFRQDSGLIDFDLKVDIEAERLQDLGQRFNEAESVRREAELRLQEAGRQRARRGSADSDVEILGSGLIQTLKASLAAKEAQLADLSKSIGRRHPQHIALTAEIANLRADLHGQVNVYVAGIRGRAETASANEAALRRELDAQRVRVLEIRRLRDEGVHYKLELDAAEKIYNAALTNYDRILIGGESRYSNASIVSSAIPPLLHSKPLLRLNLLLSLLAGLFLGVASALSRELSGRRVRCREDIERDLGVTVLAELGEPKPLFSL